MKRIALGIEYDGSGLYGWQEQREVPTVQGVLQTALAKVANEPIALFCAGRTDANVHATNQVAHFDTHAKRHIDAWIWGTNAHLPPGIGIRWAQQVDHRFHARFKAYARRYRYIIFNHPIRPALNNTRVSWYYYPLDENRMREASKYLIGEQNFNSFRSSKCNSKTPMRHVTEVTIERTGDYIVLEIEANAFLHHMVRNIVGVLLKIGAGFHEPDWMKTVIHAENRKSAAETASPYGLYLIQVRYPEPYNFPANTQMFLL